MKGIKKDLTWRAVGILASSELPPEQQDAVDDVITNYPYPLSRNSLNSIFFFLSPPLSNNDIAGDKTESDKTLCKPCTPWNSSE